MQRAKRQPFHTYCMQPARPKDVTPTIHTAVATVATDAALRCGCNIASQKKTLHHTSNMASVSRDSMMERSPRVPVPLDMACGSTGQDQAVQGRKPVQASMRQYTGKSV